MLWNWWLKTSVSSTNALCKRLFIITVIILRMVNWTAADEQFSCSYTLQVEMGEWKAHLTSSEGCTLPWVLYSKVRICGCGLRWIFFKMSLCLYLYNIYCFSVFDGSRKMLNARRKLNLLLSDKVILIQKLLSMKGWSFTDRLLV